jgi:hypothetical protein
MERLDRLIKAYETSMVLLKTGASLHRLLFEVSTKALGSMGYLTIITRSNRVVIVSSVITRIFFIYSGQCLNGHISTFSIKTLVIYLCCA